MLFTPYTVAVDDVEVSRGAVQSRADEIAICLHVQDVGITYQCECVPSALKVSLPFSKQRHNAQCLSIHRQLQNKRLSTFFCSPWFVIACSNGVGIVDENPWWFRNTFGILLFTLPVVFWVHHYWPYKEGSTSFEKIDQRKGKGKEKNNYHHCRINRMWRWCALVCKYGDVILVVVVLFFA